MAVNRNYFRLTRFILLKVPLLFRFLAFFRRNRKRLLIIKTDAIGDFILFRNFLEIVKRSEKYKGYRIDMLGNPLWRDVAIRYDAGFVDNFYFAKQYELIDQPKQTFKLAWFLFSNNYETVLQPSSTRIFMTDGLAGLTAAKNIIGFESNTEGIPIRYKQKTDKFYTQKVVLPKEVYFEFDRSKFFFEHVLGVEIPLNAPNIPVDTPAKSGIVIFPGAGIVRRNWEKENFLALIKLVVAQTSQPIYLAGGPGDAPIGDYLTENLPLNGVTNLTGKTSLVELIELIGRSALVIANETSAVHIAAAAQTRSVCILGGGHFDRFAPYPESMPHKPLCVFKKMDCFYCNWQCIYKTEPNEAYPCISNVNLDDVWQATLQLLPPL